MITQSAYNTNPPIKKRITKESFTGRKTGYFEIGGRILDFTNAPESMVLELEKMILDAYNLGYSEASTYFLDKLLDKSDGQSI